MRMQNDVDYAVRDILRDATDIARLIADGDESVFTNPEAFLNVDNPIFNQFTFAVENEGVHEVKSLDFNGLSECESCGDVTASCDCN